MPDDFDEPPSPSGCRTSLPVVGYLTLGVILCPISAAIVIPIIFGVERRDSSAVWMLSGVADVAAGVLLSPVFIITYLITYSLFQRRYPGVADRALRALGLGLAVFIVVAVIVWAFQGGQKVLRAQ